MSFSLCVFICVLFCVCRPYTVFVFKQKTAYEVRISDWSSDVCSSDLTTAGVSHWLFTGQISASTGFVVYSALVANWVFVATNTLLLLAAILGQDRKSVV